MRLDSAGAIMSDLLRERRDQEFQRRVLAALERPKPPKWTAVVNSRLFSVLVLGIIGAIGSFYFTNYQKCLADAERLSEAWYRLTREAMTRHDAIAWTVVRATSFDDFRNIKYPNVYSDLKDKSLWEVLREKRQVARRIDFTPTSTLKISASGDTGYSADELDKYGGIAVGNVRYDLKDNELENARSFLMRYLNGVFAQYRREMRLWLHPRCTFTTVAKSIAGYQSPIITTSLNPAE